MRDARRGVAAPRSRRAPPRCGLIVGMLLACATAQVEAQRFSLGGAYSCAILYGGVIKCWGWNNKGQLGNGGTSDVGGSSGDMASLSNIDLGTSKTASKIACGGYHTCAILNDNTLKCWGKNNDGRLGDGSTSSMVSAPPTAVVDLGAGRTATAVAAGSYHTCAVLDDGSIKCWGRGAEGQLGLSYLGTDPPASTVATEAKELNYEAMDEEHRRLLQATSPLISSTDLP